MPTASFFVAVLAVLSFSGVESFAGVPLPGASSSYHPRHVSCSTADVTSRTTLIPRKRSCLHAAAAAPSAESRTTPVEVRARALAPSRVRWHSRLAASGDNSEETIQGEASDATSVEGVDGVSSATATAAPTAGDGGGAGLDLSKGIAFEAPKPKVLEPEQVEEESDSKKIRVILYTVLSLVPFVLLLPFLGSRELMPLDPSQM